MTIFNSYLLTKFEIVVHDLAQMTFTFHIMRRYIKFKAIIIAYYFVMIDMAIVTDVINNM